MSKLPKKEDLEMLEKMKYLIFVTYYIDPEDLVSKRRTGKVSEARFLLYYILRTKLKWSYPMIAEEFKKDHTTIIHGVEKVESSHLKEAALSMWSQMTFPLSHRV